MNEQISWIGYKKKKKKTNEHIGALPKGHKERERKKTNTMLIFSKVSVFLCLLLFETKKGIKEIYV